MPLGRCSFFSLVIPFSAVREMLVTVLPSIFSGMDRLVTDLLPRYSASSASSPSSV